MPPISGQSLLVIGGSSGIGAAVARLAAGQGVRVSIASSNPTQVANAVTNIKSQASIPNTHIQGFTIDLSLPDVEQRLETLLAETTVDSRLDFHSRICQPHRPSGGRSLPAAGYTATTLHTLDPQRA